MLWPVAYPRAALPAIAEAVPNLDGFAGLEGRDGLGGGGPSSSTNAPGMLALEGRVGFVEEGAAVLAA